MVKNRNARLFALLLTLLLLITPSALAKTITVDAADHLVEEDGWYDTMEEVAVYLTFFEELPDNYLTKKEAQNLGWESRKGNLWKVADGCSIGGDRFGNYEGLLPDAKGRRWTECDIDFDGSYRNGKRIVFSSDGLIYYTDDHYKSFDEIEVIWSDETEAADDGYAYKDKAADDDFGSMFSEDELDEIVNWLFGA
ncbi:MAG: ribonuclease [Clostridia bacterium]|nr:ribonuclease [Clostridia bacterium]